MELKELREQHVELVPGREALGHFDFTFAHVNAYNKAFAANVHSDDSTAAALAIQTIVIK